MAGKVTCFSLENVEHFDHQIVQNKGRAGTDCTDLDRLVPNDSSWVHKSVCNDKEVESNGDTQYITSSEIFLLPKISWAPKRGIN